MSGLDYGQSSAELAELVEKLRGWGSALVLMLPNLLIAAVVLSAAVLASRLLPRVVYRLVRRTTHNDAMSRLVASAARLACVAFGLMAALGVLKLDRTVTSLLAGVGVIGLALGFAFQDIAANFMAGFIMAVHPPFRVGDMVEVAGYQCRVKRTELRATEIETLDGLSVLVPNRQVFQNPIINYARTPYRRMALKVRAAYSADMNEVRKATVGALTGLVHRQPEREIELFFEEFAESSINFEVRVWVQVTTQVEFLEARSEAMIAIKRAFDAHGIAIPFPIRTLDFGASRLGGESLRARVTD